MNINKEFIQANRNQLLFFGFSILVAVLVASYIVAGNRVTVLNRAQEVSACKELTVECSVGIPNGVDPSKYSYLAYVTKAGETTQLGSTQVDTIVTGDLSGGNYAIDVPISALQFGTYDELNAARLQCHLRVTEKAESANGSTCEQTFDGDSTTLDACQQICPDCYCVEDGELVRNAETGGINYEPKAQVDACWQICNQVSVIKKLGGKTDGSLNSTPCDKPFTINEGGSAENLCATYYFSKTKKRYSASGETRCTARPENDSCEMEVCCQTDPAVACQNARVLNAPEKNLCSNPDCQFTVVSEEECPGCQDGLIGYVNTLNKRTIPAQTLGAWDHVQFTWDRFEDKLVEVNTSSDTDVMNYNRGGTYKLKLVCFNGTEENKLEPATCEQYFPVVCASCGDGGTTPPPTPTHTPVPTVLSCPITPTIQLEFNIRCENCVLTPTPLVVVD